MHVRRKFLIIEDLHNRGTSARAALNLVDSGGHIGVCHCAVVPRVEGTVPGSLSLSMVIDSRRCILGIGWVGGVTGSTVDVVRGRRRERAGVEGNEKEEVEKVPPSDPLSSELQASCRAFESALEEVNESERVDLGARGEERRIKKERVSGLRGTGGEVARQGQTGHDRENDAGARRCAFLARYVVVLRDNERSRPRARDT